MKLTDELKSKINAAETLEEKKAIIAESGMELTDDEIEGVAGGFFCEPQPVPQVYDLQ